jgi:hypothetical protein
MRTPISRSINMQLYTHTPVAKKRAKIEDGANSAKEKTDVFLTDAERSEVADEAVAQLQGATPPLSLPWISGKYIVKMSTPGYFADRQVGAAVTPLSSVNHSLHLHPTLTHSCRQILFAFAPTLTHSCRQLLFAFAPNTHSLL